MNRSLAAAAIQFFATPLNPSRNLETAERLVREAASQGAQVIVLPELFASGYVYSPRLFEYVESAGGPTVLWLARLSAELGLLLSGTILLREGRRIFNTFILAEPNGALHKYRKQHLFLWERYFFEAGNSPVIANTEFGRIGLMVCWDIAHARVWEAYRGKVGAVLIASAPPRFHRAVLNFPGAKKVYLAEMMPELLRDREAIDGWYSDSVVERAKWLGAPVVHSVMAGRFVTAIPFPRLSFLAGAIGKPKLWPLAQSGQAHLATLRATFYGTSAVFDEEGKMVARVKGEEGIAFAEIDVGARVRVRPGGVSILPPLPGLPARLKWMEWMMRVVAGRYYRQRRELRSLRDPQV